MTSVRPTDDDRLLYRVAFASLRGINRRIAADLREHIGWGEEFEKEFFKATESALAAVNDGRPSHLFERAYRDSCLERARREIDFIAKNHIRTLYFADEEEYPRRLAEAVDAPLMLYTLGTADLNSPAMIAVVGTRHTTAYGAGFIDRLISDLASSLTVKPVIVSGLAYGADIAAHRAALREELPTAAVLAHGLNTLYPSQHRRTAADMVRNGGMLVTDYLSSDPVHKGNFPARNRIVAGLVDCLVVVESAAKGGSLITARIANEYNRDVFAVPGRVGDRYSEGCNNLIAGSAAHLLTGADALIDMMNWPRKPREEEQLRLFPPLSADDQAIIDLLATRGEARANEIAIALGRPVGRVMASLVDLEFNGRVTPFPGGLYRTK